MERLSAVLITKNEARNVERCLRSLVPVVDEIVVVDGFSTDGTREICERLGARVVQQAWLGFGPQKNLANGLAANEWILSVDADEALDPSLQLGIASAKAQGLSGCYEISRLNSYYGKFLRHGFEYPDRKVRLFPRSKVRWNESLVHEGLVLDERLPVTRLPGHLLHFTYGAIEEHVAKANRYTSLAAKDAFERGRPPSLAKLLGGPLVTFLRSYVWKRGFLDGWHGLVVAKLHAQAAFLKHAKLWELHRAARAELASPAAVESSGRAGRDGADGADRSGEGSR
jgi:glycosyltransferase involved in cell wall biosynthesis